MSIGAGAVQAVRLTQTGWERLPMVWQSGEATQHGAEDYAPSAEGGSRIGQRPDFKEFLLSGPNFDALELERVGELPREIDWDTRDE